MADLQISSGFSLSGGTLGSVSIQKFSGIKIEVGTSSNIVGNKVGGNRELGSLAGPPTPGNPRFTAAIVSGSLPLARWWVEFNPNFRQGPYVVQDLIFSFEGGSGVVAEWQLIGVFPKSYEVSDAEANSAELATETIELCVTAIKRTV